MIDPPCAHRPGRPLRPDHDAVQVDCHDAVEVPEVVIHQSAGRAGDPGVVHHHVQLAELLLSVLDRVLHAVRVGDVGVNERRGLAQYVHQFDGGLIVDVGDDDPSAFLDEHLGDRPSDAVRATGDDRDLPRELIAHVSPIPRCSSSE